MKKQLPLIVSLTLGLVLGTSHIGYSASQVLGGSPDSYKPATLADAQQQLAALQGMLQSGNITPGKYQDLVTQLIANTKNLSTTPDSNSSATSGMSVDNNSTVGLPFNSVAPGASANDQKVCINVNGYNTYTISGPSKESWTGSGPACFSGHGTGSYCVAVPNGMVSNSTTCGAASSSGDRTCQTSAAQTANSSGDTTQCFSLKDAKGTLDVKLAFKSPVKGISFDSVLDNLGYYDSYKVQPLRPLLDHVYYNDGGKGISIVPYLSKIFIKPNQGALTTMPPPLENMYVNINGDMKPLTDFISKMYFLSGKDKFPIGPNLHNITIVQK